MMRGALSLLSVLLLLTGMPALTRAAPAQDQKQKLNSLEDNIRKTKDARDKLAEEADAARIEIEAITTEMVKRTKSIMDLEDEARDIEDAIAKLEPTLAVQEESLASRRSEMAQTLAALQRLSDRPAETVLLQPGDAIDTVRSATLLSTTLPEIKERARVLRDDIIAINALRRDLEAQKQSLAQKRTNISSRKSDLERLLKDRTSKRQSLLSQAEKQDSAIKRMAEEAKSLRELIENLEREAARITSSQPLPPSGSFYKAKGKLPYPVSGRVVERYGHTSDSGRSRGIRVKTNDHASVISPFDGRVVYAGPYRSYGQILIIAHGEGYHSLLAGLARIDGQVGQAVLAGEPVGITGESGTGVGPAELYIEIRKGGTPIDPSGWFRSSGVKGQ